MKILITGCTGMLGTSILLEKSNHEFFGIYLGQKPRFQKAYELDITNQDQVELFITKIHPDAIIHTAALTNVEQCENAPQLAAKVHVKGTENLVKTAKRINAYFLYISTDSVFDGKRGMYRETDEVNPLNVYAKTKYEGELKALEYSNAMVARTNIYGWNFLSKNSLAEWMLKSLRQNQVISLFQDVFYTPILTNDLSRVLLKSCEEKIDGLYHVGGGESLSKLQFGLYISEFFNCNKSLIKPISIKESPLQANRPLNPTLDCSKIQKKLNIHLPLAKEGIIRFKQLEENGYIEKLKNI